MRPAPPDSTIPAVWCVDVEPDVLQLERGAPTRWSSFEAMLDLVDGIRGDLAAVTGRAARVSWFFRMDPQIAETHGDAAFVATAYHDELDHLRATGDVFGIHPHALRWSDARHEWFNDFADRTWPVQCVEVTAAAFERAFGAPPRYHRFGTCFLSEAVVACLDRLGVAVDLTVEPGTLVLDAHHAAAWNPIEGSTPDYRHAPSSPYHPRRDDVARRAGRAGAAVTVVPMSAAVLSVPRPAWWRAARLVRHGFRLPRVPLSPWRSWGSPQRYWDVVERHLASMAHPYFAFSVRTDPWESPAAVRARELMAHLPHHRLAERLRFVDPLELAVDPQ